MTNYFERATQRLGGYPAGDPESMRCFARLLRARAGVFASAASGVRAVSGGSGLTAGTTAEAIKSRASSIAQGIDLRLVAEVGSIADRLDHEATQLENDQAEHRIAAERLAVELESRERGSGGKDRG